jgi:nucleotide-binding universal stress UspA family protein
MGPSIDLQPVLYCADGSPVSTAALRAGRTLIGDAHRALLATVVGERDPSLVGTGFGGGVMSHEECATLDASVAAAGRALLDEVAGTLGPEFAESERVLLRGPAGPALCDYADQVGAVAMVLGSRGRGGIKRAMLGSCSDHVVRNAPCTVVVTNADAIQG